MIEYSVAKEIRIELREMCELEGWQPAVVTVALLLDTIDEFEQEREETMLALGRLSKQYTALQDIQATQYDELSAVREQLVESRTAALGMWLALGRVGDLECCEHGRWEFARSVWAEFKPKVNP